MGEWDKRVASSIGNSPEINMEVTPVVSNVVTVPKSKQTPSVTTVLNSCYIYQ